MSHVNQYEILSQWGVIRATGEDAATFLHSQLTQDVLSLQTSQARLAAYCNAKGRMQASLMITRAADGDIYLLARTGLVASLVKRLSMFVLRAKCKLSDVSTSVQAIAVLGKPNDAVGAQAMVLADWPSAGSSPRYLMLVNSDGQSHLVSALQSAGFVHAVHSDQMDLAAGIAHIEPATHEAFIPQMINFDLVGGVNFQKGCYPGQEIVARAHYLGKQKRRMQLGRVDSPDVSPGMDIYASDQTNEPAGQIVNCLPNPQGGSDVLFEIPLDRLANGVSLHTGTVDGPAITLQPLPYDIPVKAA